MGGWGWGGRGRRAGRAPGDGASNRRFRSGPGQQGAGGRTPSVPQPPIGRPLLRFRLRPVSRRRDRSAELPGSGRHFSWGGGGLSTKAGLFAAVLFEAPPPCPAPARPGYGSGPCLSPGPDRPPPVGESVLQRWRRRRCRSRAMSCRYRRPAPPPTRPPRWNSSADGGRGRGYIGPFPGGVASAVGWADA